MKIQKYLPLCLFVMLVGCLPAQGGSDSSQEDLSSDAYTGKNNIPPRLEWNANYGYCGETSLICAGLYYGQYISQYEARAIASNNTPQCKKKSQLLLGVNDTYAASRMHLSFVEWDSSIKHNTPRFLKWVKKHVLKGCPVAIGVYTNEYLFYQNTDPDAGDPDYDHIVVVIGWGSNHSLSNFRYYANDRIYFSDNGLWGNPKNPPFIFDYPVGSFQGNRQSANAKNGSIYTLPNQSRNYGLAVTGVMDLNGDTLPIRIDTNLNDEKPAIKNRSNKKPKPSPLVLTITISQLEPGVKYHVYKYNALDLVPDSDFNAHASHACESWKVEISSGNTFVMTQRILSDEVAVFRAVRADAP